MCVSSHPTGSNGMVLQNRTLRRGVLAALLLVSSPASAAETDEPLATQAARRHFDSGVVFYEKGDYEAARIEFEAAYRLTKHPDLLVNLCVVAEKQARFGEAITYCDQYLRAVPSAQDTDSVRLRLERLRQLSTGAPEPSKPTPDHPAEAAKPPVAPALPAAPPAASVESPGADRPRSRPPIPAMGLLVGGGALLLGGIGTGSAALVASKEIESMTMGIDSQDLARRQERGRALNAATIALSVTGGVAVIAGAGWLGYWLRSRR